MSDITHQDTHSRQRGSPRRPLAAGGAAMLILATVPFGAGRVNAEPLPLTFTASASAYGSQLKLTSPGAPVSDTVVNAGGPTANAVLDGVGGSRAYGSFPFPGELAATAPGLVRGLSNVPVPDYPFYAASYHPAAPRQESSAGGIVLRAQSSEDASSAVASVAGFAHGPGGTDGIGVSRSETWTTNGADGVAAKAESVTAGIQLEQLKLASVVSSVEVTLSPEGLRRRSASLRITGIELGGQAVTTSQSGITVGDEAVPGTDPAPLIDALDGAGFSLRIAPASRTDTGMTAPALAVSRRMDSGETFTVNFGAATAGIDSPGATDAEGQQTPTDGVPASPVASADGEGSGSPDPRNPESESRVAAVPPTPMVEPSRTAAALPVPAILSQSSAANPGLMASGSSSSPWADSGTPAPIGASAAAEAEVAQGAGASGGGTTLGTPAPERLNRLWTEMIVRSSSGSPLFGIVIVGGVLAVGMTAWLSRKPRSVS